MFYIIKAKSLPLESKTNMNSPLTPHEFSLFRALVKSAVIVLLLMRLDRPAGAREMADILGLEEHTTARYLRQLAKINIIARSGYRGGYVLLEGRQLIFGGGRTVENLQFSPIITTDTEIKDESIVIIDSARTVEKLQFDENLSPVEQALKEAGISNPKRRALASLPEITPESIKAWETNLKFEKGDKYKPGLLIYMLESGEPTPPVSENGHHLKCECEECQRMKYREWERLGGTHKEDDEEDDYYDDDEYDEGESEVEDEDGSMGIPDDDGISRKKTG